MGRGVGNILRNSGAASTSSSIMSKGSHASSSLHGGGRGSTVKSASFVLDELGSVSQYSIMSEHDIGKLESYIKICIDELPVETPDLLFAGRKSTMLLQSLLRIFLFDNDDVATGGTGGNSKTPKEMPPGGVMVVFPSQDNEVKQTLLIVRDKELAKELAVKCGAIESVTRLMRTFKDSPRYQSKACELLGILAQDQPSHQTLIAREHGVSFILAVLLHPQISKQDRICLDACRALGRICTPSSKQAISQLVEGCDGIQALRQVIKRYSSDKYSNLHQEILQTLVNVVSYAEEKPPESLPTGETTNGNPVDGIGGGEEDDGIDDDDGMWYPFLQHVEDPDLIEDMMKDVLCKYSKKSSSTTTDKCNELGYLLITKLAVKGKRMGTRNALVRKKAVPVILRGMTRQYDLTKPSCLKQLRGLQALYACSKERPEARDVILESDEGFMAILDAMLLSHRTFPLMASGGGVPTLSDEVVVGLKEEDSSSAAPSPSKKRVLGPDNILSVSIPQKACQLLDLLCFHEENKKTHKSIAKHLKKDVKYRDMLKDFKSSFPQECGQAVDKLIDAYNKQYGF